MVLFPNAKINLGLNIVQKRPDKYHNIETIFYPIGLSDILEGLPTEKNENKGLQLHLSGLNIDQNSMSNLVAKAYHLLTQEFKLPDTKLFLHKIVPLGAGLGGGSADASFTLKLLNNLYQLNLSNDQLAERAARLGADCPFFIYNTPLLARGIGNIFQPIEISLKGYHLVLIKPEVQVSTIHAYQGVTPTPPPHTLSEIIQYPIHQWKDYLKNDFETSIFAQFPIIETAKKWLYEQGAIYASMSGSGASVFGLFPHETKLIPPAKWFIWQGKCEL